MNCVMVDIYDSIMKAKIRGRQQSYKNIIWDAMTILYKNPKIPLKKVEDQIVPYFETIMTHGSPCDLKSGVPRKSLVLYVCSEGNQNEIAHLEETSTCEYTFIIYTHQLYKHPYYQREEPMIQSIQCFGKDGKPKKLSDFEQAHKSGMSSSEAESPSNVDLEVVDPVSVE